MSREQGQFDEAFGAQVIRKPDPPEAPPPSPTAPPGPLTPEQLGALLCRFRAVHIGTGDEILVVMSTENWRELMAAYDLSISRRTP